MAQTTQTAKAGTGVSKGASTGASASPSASERNLLGAVSYLWILSIVMYVLKKDDEFVLFHAKQGIVIFIMSIIGFIPVVGWPFGLLAFVLVVIGFVKAYQGEKYKFPIISDIAAQIKF